MMRCFLGVLLALMLFLGTAAWVGGERKEDELAGMASFIKQEKLDMEGWERTFKESIPKQKVYSILEEIGQRGTWSEEKSEKAVKYFLNNRHKTSGLLESYIVVIPKEGDNAELIIVLKGEDWNGHIASAYDSRKEMIEKTFFTEAMKTFACMSARSDDIIKDGFFLKKIQQKLNIKHIVTQEEKFGESGYKNIIYGYIPLWSEEIRMGQHPMNMQAVMTKTKHNGTKVMIGTPILIHEY